MAEQQMELIPKRRARVNLIEDDEPEFTPRPTLAAKTARQAIDEWDRLVVDFVKKNMPAGSTWNPEIEGPELTAWCKELPPCIGYWEVTDDEGGLNRGRWWFDGEAWSTPPGRAFVRAHKLPHSSFVKVFSYRGLTERPSSGYPFELETRHPGLMPAEYEVKVKPVRIPLED